MRPLEQVRSCWFTDRGASWGEATGGILRVTTGAASAKLEIQVATLIALTRLNNANPPDRRHFDDMPDAVRQHFERPRPPRRPATQRRPQRIQEFHRYDAG